MKALKLSLTQAEVWLLALVIEPQSLCLLVQARSAELQAEVGCLKERVSESEEAREEVVSGRERERQEMEVAISKLTQDLKSLQTQFEEDERKHCDQVQQVRL